MLVHLHIHMCIYQFYRFDDALCMSIISGVVNFGTLGQERALYSPTSCIKLFKLLW